jgi:tetratricopeptide (TPR) repeat protein
MLEEPDIPDKPDKIEQPDYSRYLNAKFIGIIAFLIFIAGIITEFLNSIFSLGIPPGTSFTISVLLATILACCGSLTTLGSIGMKLPEYGEMESKFQEGKELYDNGDWDEALDIFKELSGPRMNHKRALYYGARCYEYLEMQPKDKEVWELLAMAHKRLFEYEEANEAQMRAEKLK